MPAPQNRPRPVWVSLGLFGLPTRAAAWLCFWLGIALAIGCPIYGYQAGDPRFYWGALFLLASLWYFACIQWVDRHDRWK